MKVKKLSLANFRGFEQIDIGFEDDVTVIAGVNGVGKSSILKAVATILSRAMPEFTPSRSQPNRFEDDDIYYNKTSLEVSLQLALPEQTIYAGLQRIRNDEKEGDRLLLLRQQKVQESLTQDFKEALTSRTLTGDLEAGIMDTKEALHSLKTQPNPPIAIYFSPKRQLPGKPKSLPPVEPFDISRAFSRALHDREVELREFMHWFHTQEVLAQEGDKKRLNVLDALRGVVSQFVPEFSNLHIEKEPRLAFVVEKSGKPLFLHQLSDGERGLLAMVFDISRRLAIANPESENPLQEGKAVVMIDEIELHLHPKWQREVLGRLQSVFQNCQFIVTTHSPMVLGETKARSVRFLEYDDDRVVVTIPEEAYGMDANRILQELMGAPIRNKKIETKLNTLFDLIDDEDFKKAKEKMKELSMELGEFDPELTRASSLIHFLEGGE